MKTLSAPNEQPSKILIVTRNLPPLLGGMERLNWNIAKGLAETSQVTLVGPGIAKNSCPATVNFIGARLKPLWLFLISALFKALFITFRNRPCIILAGSGLTAPIALICARITGAKAVTYTHGLDVSLSHPLYKALWLPCFRHMDTIIANSTPTQNLLIERGIQKEKIAIIHPGADTPETPITETEVEDFKNQYNLTKSPILLSVGRLTTRKGLKEFVANSLGDIVKDFPQTKLLIIGEAPENSLYAKPQTRKEILHEAKIQGLIENLIFTGNITNLRTLQTAYTAGDVHIFPVRDIPDDPEGFGMVAIEAAAQGLPTVAFATGGIIDAVNEGISGHLVRKGNYPEFSKKVLEALGGSITIKSTVDFSKNFSWSNFNHNLWICLSKTLEYQKPQRQSHAAKDLSSRTPKAQKIESLLELKNVKDHPPLRLLEIGCGSGGITHYFGTHSTLRCEATGIDIHDNRKVEEGYKFLKVDGVDLPFSNSSFDIVITNHVIEHVGEADDQLQHIKEIERVLAPNGLCYLAVPNRWMLTEPHYNLKFLSWLPRRLRSHYLRWSGKGNFYDCEPLELSELETILKRAGTHFENISIPAAKITFEQEKPKSITTKLLRILPNSLLNPFKPVIPTLIYRLKSKK